MTETGLVALRSNVTASVQRMSNTQRATLAAAFLATALAVFFVARFSGDASMKLLYADLEPKTAAAIVDELDSRGIPYELTNGGRMIMVPAAQVHAIRLDLSAQDLPATSDGWSVLDNQGITTSQFDQRVGYQRAMEGELAKTISAIDGVNSAKVHLVIPEDDLFVSDEVAASASVLLIATGSPISSSQVQAITNLVASSVEGLSPERVSITDQRGRVLAAPGAGAGSMGIESDDRLRTSRQFEAALESDIEELLSTVVGRNKAVVNVTADLEFDSVQTVTESFQPTQNEDGSQTVLAETSRDEVYENLYGDGETGVLGTEVAEAADIVANGGDAANNRSNYTLDERDATYAVNKVVTNATNTPGEVVGLSVAVLLDEEAVSADQLEELTSLVAAAAGIDPERGDAVEVSLLPMNEDVKAEIEAANAAALEIGGGLDIIGLVRTVGSIIVALVVVFFGLRMLRAKPQTAVETIDLSDLEDDTAALAGDLGNEAAAIKSATRAAAALTAGEEDQDFDPEEELRNLLNNQPDDVAGVLRTWLTEDETEVSA